MNLNDWLLWLENYKDTNIELRLDRILLVAKKLNLDKPNCPVITVAGTNGKGSTVAVLEAIALAAGLQVGCYTSPHLFSFTERIKINGCQITEQDCITHLQIIKDHIPSNTYLTYFEFATLAALRTFKCHNLDLIILEVGLGGRLDAVNIIANQISIITSIALDHCQYLGDSIASIAYEKAGIIKANNLVVCASNNGIEVIKQQAKSCHATVKQLQQHFKVQEYKNSWDYLGSKYHINNLALTAFPVNNAACAIAAIEELAFNITEPQILQAIAKVNILGRFQVLHYPDEMVLDVAHNPEAANWLAKKLAVNFAGRKITAIVNMAADKDWLNIIKPFLPLVDLWYTATIDNPRLLPAASLAARIESLTNNVVFCYDDIGAAITNALQNKAPDAIIVIFGSFFTVAAALQYLYEKYGKIS